MKNVSFRRVFHYYWLQAKKYRLAVFLVFVFFGIASAVSNGLVPMLYRKLIDTLTAAEDPSLVAPILFSLVFNLAIAAVIANICYRIGDFLVSYSQSAIQRELANDTFERIERHGYHFFANEFAGSLVAKARRFVERFVMIQDQIAFQFWMNGVLLAVVVGTLIALAPLVGLFFLGWVVVFIGVVCIFIRYQKRFDLTAAEEDSKVTGRLADVITNILNVKMFATRRNEAASFGALTEHLDRARRKAWYFESVMWATQGTLMMLLEVGGMYLAIRLWLSGSISTGTIVLVQVYFGRVFGSVWNLGHSISRFTRGMSDAAEMVEVFDTPIDIEDPPQPQEISEGQGEIRFEHVSFRYGKDNTAVLRDFTLTIRAGERVGIVGHSGAGKTTITKLILRFLDIQEGAILLDGQNVHALRQDDLRHKISYVPQEPMLFHRSLRENISYGNLQAADEEILEAAKKAHAHEFIVSLPLGYDTLVGERGVKLSGGERQRVAIARAMLKDAPILMLDEATSSLDSKSEKYIQEAFEDLMQGKTTIVIAHRLSTIQKMDRIIVLEKGQIAEEGSHQELLEKKGLYYDLWAHQAGGFIL
jgi:ATP-binding cassette subfamily B protein